MGRTNIELNEEILKEAMELTKIKTKKELVNFAISELVNKLRRKKFLNLRVRSIGKEILKKCERIKINRTEDFCLKIQRNLNAN